MYDNSEYVDCITLDKDGNPYCDRCSMEMTQFYAVNDYNQDSTIWVCRSCGVSITKEDALAWKWFTKDFKDK